MSANACLANAMARAAKKAGVENAFDFPGFVPAYIRPLFCRGVGPFRWCALSGDPEDIYKTDAKVKELMPDDAHLHQWLDMARERIRFQGLPELPPAQGGTVEIRDHGFQRVVVEVGQLARKPGETRGCPLRLPGRLEHLDAQSLGPSFASRFNSVQRGGPAPWT